MVSSVASKVTMAAVTNPADANGVFGLVNVAAGALGLYLQQSTRRTNARLDLTQALGRVLELG